MKSTKKVDTEIELTKIVFENGHLQYKEVQEDLKEVREERDKLKLEYARLQKEYYELYVNYQLQNKAVKIDQGGQQN